MGFEIVGVAAIDENAGQRSPPSVRCPAASTCRHCLPLQMATGRPLAPPSASVRPSSQATAVALTDGAEVAGKKFGSSDAVWPASRTGSGLSVLPLLARWWGTVGAHHGGSRRHDDGSLIWRRRVATADAEAAAEGKRKQKQNKTRNMHLIGPHAGVARRRDRRRYQAGTRGSGGKRPPPLSRSTPRTATSSVMEYPRMG
jgi:hypothetical protein